MTDDLKLFGEVGLGYGQLQKDAEEINNLILNINKNLGVLSEDLNKQNLDLNVKFDPKSEKQLNDLAMAIKHIEDVSTVANKATKNMTSDFEKIGKNVNNLKGGFESANKVIQDFNKNANLKNPFEGIVKSDLKSVTKDLEEYYNKINRFSNKEFNLENLGKALNDELRYTSRGTEEFGRAMTMLGKYSELASAKLGEYERKIKSISEQMAKAPSAETLRSQFLKNDPLSENGILKRVDSLNGEIERRARSVAIKYVDEFGRTIQETWKTKAGSFIPSTKDVLIDPMKKGLEEQIKAKLNLEKIEERALIRGRQEEKKRSDERLANLKKEAQELEKANKPVNPSKIKNMGQTVAELYTAKRVLQDIVKIAADFQEKQIEVERIAQNNTKDAKELKEAIFEIAKETGTMVGDAQEVAGLWARTGKSGEQLKEAVKTTMMGFNVAEFKDAETAVASINAIVNQMYNGDATKSQSILDSLVKVADKTAVRNVEDLAEVASRAGANAKSLKMDLHELNAVSSIVMENMKVDGNVLGTQLKSVFAYMMNDGRMKKLEKFGVEMTKNNENGTKSLKSFSEAFGDIVKKYKEFMASGDEKRANDLLSTIGGTRFTPVIKNLAENWDKFQERVDLSKDSMGFASEQNEKKMKSLNKQIMALKASATELIESIGNTGIIQGLATVTNGVKGFIDALNKLPNVVKTVIPAVSALYMSLIALSTKSEILLREGSLLYYLINGVPLGKNGFEIPGIKKGIDKLRGLKTESEIAGAAVKAAGTDMAKAGKNAAEMANEASKAGKAVKTAGDATKNMTGAAVASGSAIGGLRGAFAKATSSVKGLVASLSLTAPQLAILVGSIAAVTAAVIHFKKEREKAFENTANGNLDKEIESIDKMHDAYLKLQNDNEAFKEGTQAYDQLVDVQGRLAEALGVSKDAYIVNADTMEYTNKAIESRIELRKSEFELEKQKGKAEAESIINNADDKFGFGSLDSKARKVEQAAARMERASNRLSQAQKENLSKVDIDMAQREFEQATKSYYTNVENLYSLIEKVKKAGELLGKEDIVDEMLENLGHGDLLDTIKNKLDEKAEASRNAADGAEEHAASMEAEQEQLKKLADDYDNVSGKLSAMESARKEYNEKGELSLGTVTSLVSKYPELANCIEKVGEKYLLNKGFIDEQNKSLEEQKELTEDVYNQGRTVSQANVGSTLGAIGDTLDSQAIDEFINKLRDLDSEVANTVGNLSQQFMNGEIPATQFFQSLNRELQNIDFSKLSPMEIQSFSNAISMYLNNAISSLNQQLNSGEIPLSTYRQQLNQVSNQALQLYVKLNNLKQVNGNWVDSNGKINEYANALQKTADKAKKAEGAIEGVTGKMRDFGEVTSTAIDEAGNLTLSFGDVTEEISGFAEDFTGIMEGIKNTNSTLWDQIVGDVAEATGMTVEEASNALLGVGESSEQTNKALNIALNNLMGQLATSTAASGKQTTGAIGAIGDYLRDTKFEFFAEWQKPKWEEVHIPLIDKTLKFPSRFGFVFGSRTISNGSYNAIGNATKAISKGNMSMSAMWAASGRAGDGKTILPQYRTAMSGSDAYQNMKLRDQLNNLLRPRKSKRGNSRLNNNNDDSSHDILDRDTSGSGSGSGGGSGRGGGKGRGGGGSKSSSSKQDIPEKVQKQIDDLRHKLDMDEMDQYQYAKEIEKILNKNKNILTEKGIREIEKMVYDAKKGGVKDGFKAHIDELKNLNELAEQTIQSLETEKQMIDSLNLNPSMKLSVNQDLSEVYAGKLVASMAMMRKYQLAIDEIDREIKSLNSSSVGYSKTVEELNKVKEDYLKKLNQEEIAIIKVKDATAKLAMEQYKIKQMQIDKAIEGIERYNQLTIQMINGRNEKIKERVQDRHRAEMEALEKENDAKNKAHKKQMDRMQREADAFRRYMEDKLKELNRENAKEDYEDVVDKKSKEITELKKRITLVSLDDSYKAKGEVIKLKKTLNDKQEELDKIHRDRARTLNQESIQDQLTEYERQLQGKQDLMNKEIEAEEEKNNNALELLRKRQEAEMKALDETMSAKAVAAEAEIAIKTGVVKDIDGKSRNLKESIISYMQEIGEWSGMLSEKMIIEFNALAATINNSLQMLGLGGKASFGPLQQKLGLTDESYTAWKQEVSNKTGVAFEDVEEYVQNKMAWSSASPEERKRLNEANHLIRQKIVDSHGGDQSYNKDKNGLVFGVNQLLPNKQDKRWNYVQNKPRFANYQGMTREGSEKLFNYENARRLYPEKASQITGDIRTLRQYEPSAANYNPGDILGNKFSSDLSKMGHASSILDIPADDFETEELKRLIQNKRSELSGGSGGSSSGLGTGAVDYDRMVNEIMGNASQQKKDFIRKILPKAMEASKKYNINLPALLGQASIESGWGTSDLARKDNALFGIKWTQGYGKSQSGRYRAYSSWGESVEDFARMLSGNGGKSHWASRGVAGSSSPEEHLRKIQHGGPAYAENNNYENTVLGAINGNNFRKFENIDVDRYRSGGYTGDGGVRERLLSEAHKQDGMPYSMGPERATTHRDCSSYVYFATKNAGLYSGDMFYTGNMRAALAKDGWQDIGQIPKDQIRRGDIFWYVGGGVHHTEIATEDGTLKTTGAHKVGKPAGPSSWIYNYHILRHPSLNPFKNGGIADFTGPAMLHGTKANPEYIFNTPQFDALGKIVAKYASAPSIYAPRDLTSTYDPAINVQVDNLVQINGNATKETAKEIKEASTDVLKNLEKALRKRGK